jgi:recombination protein RecR
VCSICNDAQRDKTRLCIVEHPADLHALELGAFFDGRYFVLHGYLSPLDGVNPDDLGLSQLKSQIQDWGVTEVILATNPTVEGNATAFYIQEMLKDSVGLRVSRIAHGVPMGGSIEYLDGGTLFHAFNARQTL